MSKQANKINCTKCIDLNFTFQEGRNKEEGIAGSPRESMLERAGSQNSGSVPLKDS